MWNCSTSNNSKAFCELPLLFPPQGIRPRAGAQHVHKAKGPFSTLTHDGLDQMNSPGVPAAACQERLCRCHAVLSALAHAAGSRAFPTIDAVPWKRAFRWKSKGPAASHLLGTSLVSKHLVSCMHFLGQPFFSNSSAATCRCSAGIAFPRRTPQKGTSAQAMGLANGSSALAT